MSQDPVESVQLPASPAHESEPAQGAICNDTPLKQNSHSVETGHQNIDALRVFLDEELDPTRWHNGGSEFLNTAFKDITTSGRIQEFLKGSKTYDSQKKRWRLSRKPTDEKALYPGFSKILDEILTFPAFNVQNRQAVSCHHTKITHQNDGNNLLTTSPDFVILGHSGRSFKENDFPDTPTYAQCVSPIEIKTNARKGSLRRNVLQAASYARQCFIEQHNRLKVYSILITETAVRLLQFDRGGIMHSEVCNIHKHPEIFVRIILGLASDGEDVGLDDTIFWENGERWLRTLDSKGVPVLYQIVGDSPVFIRRTICGRGTFCWVVRDPQSGEEYLVKEYWRSEEREPETTFLDLVKDLTGVGQMVAHEYDERKTIVFLRGFDEAPAGFKNRIWCRVTLVRYGESLDDFEDPLHLLYAYRDIASAELGLWSIGMVHRDVTIMNTVLGSDKDLVGWRGVLIDLDMAALTTRRESLESTDTRTGSRAFQSINVLRSYVKTIKETQKGRKKARKASLKLEVKPEVKPCPHDFLDDLESLFYILCWICYRRGHDGKKLTDLPQFLEYWDSEKAESALEYKSSFLSKPVPELPSYFRRGSAFKFLLEGLRERFLQISVLKSSGRDIDQERGTLEATHPKASAHIRVFIQLVDQAIEKWKHPEVEVKGPKIPVGFATAAEIAALDADESDGPYPETTLLQPRTPIRCGASTSTSMGTSIPAPTAVNSIKRPRNLSSSGESEDELPSIASIHEHIPRRSFDLRGQPDSTADDDSPLRSKLPKRKKAKAE
ncbi:hypothetical protein BDN72DRAFT_897576 [Pluteus cervinus]|uniref:Uncharacterized protein n=1 Tax=Pluteus cervinus TaxID=181527 RepID=A0ACD3AU89_9AGAR|nr:hypothetical protein BDN72DRAFT_897576 [Pluteus cervinus]